MKLDFEQFKAAAQAEGFDEVLERKWGPSKILETHTHPFALSALVVEGEMWLTVGDDERHFSPGDRFTLERDIPHAERYGSQGATIWVGRRRG
jgi:hypothetical protein